MKLFIALILSILFTCGTSSYRSALRSPSIHGSKLLCTALAQRDANFIAFFHKRYPELFRQHDCKSLLQIAAESGDGFVVRLLIVLGVEPKGKGGLTYWTPLRSSVKSDDRLSATFELLDAGANLNVSISHYVTPLEFALEHKSKETIKELLRFGAYFSVYFANEQIFSKIMMDSGMDDIVAIMLGRAPLPESKYRYYHCLQEVKYRYPLVYENEARNSDTHVKDHSTSEGESSSWVRDYLLRTVLHMGRVAKSDLRHLLSIINSTDIFLRTPLHEAVRRNQEDYTKDLLELGADIHAVDWLGRTPLHLASLCHRKRIQKLLLERGADPTVKDKTNQSPEDLELRW